MQMNWTERRGNTNVNVCNETRTLLIPIVRVLMPFQSTSSSLPPLSLPDDGIWIRNEKNFTSLPANFGDDDFIRIGFFFQVFFFKDIIWLFPLPFTSSSPIFEKKHREETINWCVLLLEPSRGRDTSPLSVQLVRAAVGSVMNSESWGRGLPGRRL